MDIPNIPLAERARPENLDELKGQENLLGPGKPLRIMIEKDQVSSFVLWGPPGSGKTTIARIIAAKTNSDFYQINAVSSGVKDIRAIIETGKRNLLINRRTILFIDEIHRFNKAQQDALLHSVEKGTIILIGATTENPSFEVIPALRSRVMIYILETLSKEDLQQILYDVIKKDEYLKSIRLGEIDLDFLIYASGGDARLMLNIFEGSVIQEKDKDVINVSKDVIENVIQTKNIMYDKGGEEHYNVISAFIKSIRGSDPDAALYWMARMIAGGEDPLFIARRLVILASEDIGNASPNALVLAEAAFSAINKVGMPEGRIILAQCVTYLASSPKSNSSYMALESAMKDVQTKKLYPVPLHLRNAPTGLMKEIGYGREYKYPHGFEQNFLEENYFPEEMKGTQYYYPSENGQERNLRDRLKSLWMKLKKY